MDVQEAALSYLSATQGIHLILNYSLLLSNFTLHFTNPSGFGV